ncbi:SRP54-type protein [Gymnopilus junonius]|uniref:SRP54-type protein n=1 Tax=Gymnopilus junonius TaxID=109634 RepID=A0A9P5NTE5_GYMJU|nr:SRP54-type protein [Gymnopilus junonius]
MLDYCSIAHKGGIVLWSRSFTPDVAQLASSSTSPVNSLIREALIEGRTADNKYEKDGYAVKWTFVNDLELIFVVAYQRILQLAYVDDLLAAMKRLFVQYFQPFVTAFAQSLHDITTNTAAIQDTPWNFTKSFQSWDVIFDKLLKGLEEKAALDRKSRLRSTVRPTFETITPPSDDHDTIPSIDPDAPQDEEQISRSVQALKNRLRGRGGRRGPRGRGRVDVAGSRESVADSDSDSQPKRKSKTKIQRKWGDEAPTESDMASLDFSEKVDPSAMDTGSHDLQSLVDQSSMGTRTQDGLYEVKDWDFAKDRNVRDATDDAIANALKPLDAKLSTESSSLGSTFGSIFARLTGSKALTEADLKPVLDAVKHHLMKKNVAVDIAEKVCEGVGESLIGRKVGGFQTVNNAVRVALSTSLTRILTPKTSTDLLLSIRTKLSSPLPSSQQRMPYTIAFVGVNGVGKSTNLSKVCFWLIQNGLRVLIAACDTFRSGAVEQLRVHVRNLSMLGVNGATDSKGRVELYEKGYGKDAAGIAREAITYARDNDFDVVLIDTAGRMQDNEPLMRALAKLVSLNSPDKIIFVGEALVGNEAVDQLTKFDRALRDFSSTTSVAKGRGIDGMLVTKWDTVDDKVGAALSMTYVTGQPIFFVGCGQTYTDLRQLRVSNVVQAIMKD